MAANTSPITPIAPASSWDASSPLVAAETNLVALTNYKTLITAGANGARIGNVNICPLGTNVQTVMRFFINNGSAPGTNGNNQLIKEITLPASTASANTMLTQQQIALGVVLKPGHKLLYTIGTAVAAGFGVTAIDAGDY